MGAPRVEVDRLQDLVRFHRESCSRRRASKLLGMSRNTMASYATAIAAAGLLDGDPKDLPSIEDLAEAILEHLPPTPAPQQVSSVEKYAGDIATMLKRGAGPKAIFDCLRLTPGFDGTYPAIKRFCRHFTGTIRPQDVAIPIAESPPGERAQVDFGYVGKIYDAARGVLRRAWVFVMVLSYSRHQFAKIVFDQKVETWLNLHVEAFARFGGIVGIIMPDNLKAAVIRAAFAADCPTTLNRSYRELGRHFGFQVDPAPPRQPRKKGTVESSVKYVKRNFFKARDLSQTDISSAQVELDRWIDEIAGTRTHGTTRQQPLEVFERVERASLAPLPAALYEPVIWHEAKVHVDSHVAFDRGLYSVPWTLIGRTVSIRATPTTVMIYAGDERVATHERRAGRRNTIDSHLPEHRADLRHRGRGFWEERADRLGVDVGAYIREVFESDDVLCMIRTVQSIVTHLERFPVERAQATCRRASFFASYTYRAIKNILRGALDLEALPAESDFPVQGELFQPRHARAPSEFASPSSGSNARAAS